MKTTKHDVDDAAGDERGCSRQVHLQVTPAMYAELDAAWRAGSLRSRNDWIRAAIRAALAGNETKTEARR